MQVSCSPGPVPSSPPLPWEHKGTSMAWGGAWVPGDRKLVVRKWGLSYQALLNQQSRHCVFTHLTITDVMNFRETQHS